MRDHFYRLYRYLALGPSDFIAEIGELKTLVAGDGALRGALSADKNSALSILRSMELYFSELEIKDEAVLVEVLCAFATQCVQENGDDAEDIGVHIDHCGNVLESLVRASKGDRKELVLRMINGAPLSISQQLMTKAAEDLGLWSEGHRGAEEKAFLKKDEYNQLLMLWISQVRYRFYAGIDFVKEPHRYAMLYRLGQLGDDYEMARLIAKRLLEQGDLRRLMRATQLSGEFQITFGHLDIVWSGDELLKLIEKDPKNVKRYEKAINLLRNDQTRDYFARRTTRPTKKWPPE